jgi:hypothetical protein
MNRLPHLAAFLFLGYGCPAAKATGDGHGFIRTGELPPHCTVHRGLETFDLS